MSGFVGHGRAEVTPADALIGVDEHRDAILDLLPTPEPIELRLADALGLVLAQQVTSEVAVPSFANAAMDGFALRAADIAGASEDDPAVLDVDGEVLAGQSQLPRVAAGTCVRIMTGAPVPPGADTVVAVETTSAPSGNVADAAQVRFHLAASEGQHIRRAGEDLDAGQLLMAPGRRLDATDLALLAAAGTSRVVCVPAPRVVIIVSGDELVPADKEPGPGQIRDANGPMLAAMVRAAGAVPFSVGIIGDDHKALANAFETNQGHADLFLCTGGASAGTHDLLPDVIESLGTAWTSKVAMRPGMPQIRGLVGGCPVIGLPGNPVSAFVSFEAFVRPALRKLQGRRDVERPTVVARAAQDFSAPAGKRGYLRVRLTHDEAGWLASLTGQQGSHLISSIARADGLAVVPEDVTRIAAGEPVLVQVLAE